jgi:hypothetical protein
MDQIFNERSVSCCYTDKYAAQSGMENVITISRELSERGLSPDIRTPEDFYARKLATEYSIVQWATDNNVDIEQRRYFLTHATKAPYIESLIQESDENRGLREFVYEGIEALGLGLAYLWDSPSLSLCGDIRFAIDPVQITQQILTDEGELHETQVDVCSLCRKDHIENRAAWLQNRLQRSVTTGNELIENREQLLPHLQFSQNAINQALQLTGNEQYFHEMVRHLFVIETAIREWQSGALRLGNVTYSHESQPTMDNRTLREKRQFVCQDLEKRTFSLHTKIKSANKRIYFFPLLEEQVIHIGYIGDHLPTVLYGT